MSSIATCDQPVCLEVSIQILGQLEHWNSVSGCCDLRWILSCSLGAQTKSSDNPYLPPLLRKQKGRNKTRDIILVDLTTR